MTTSRADFIVAVDPASPPVGLAGAVVAIGNFDGVHRGHRAVIGKAMALARERGRPCAVLTFEPHPADFFAAPGVEPIFRLTPPDAKAVQLSRLGLDGMVALTFDAAMAATNAHDFVADILVRRLAVSAAVVGYDFHFGAKRSGTPVFLREEGMRHGFHVEIIPRVAVDESGSLDTVSSTSIRRLLEAADVAEAARRLGHSYFVIGEVVHGAKLGRTLGFPTANLELGRSNRLAHGIYAVRLRVEGRVHDGVASFGRRPTFDNGAALLETFVFDFSGDLYGKTVEIDFIGWIRGEAKFASADALVTQMNADAAQARAMLAATV